MRTASNLHSEVAEKVRGIAPGGIGAIPLRARTIGLIPDRDERLHLRKRHRPSHQRDPVLNLASNLLAGGSRREQIEARRHDEVSLDALGAQRLPDPTTAGDFCRRFTEGDVPSLRGIFNETRLRVWSQPPDPFFEDAVLDADGTIAPSDGGCQPGGDIASNGTWGDPPLVVARAHTAEPLFLVNRSGNRPSHEPADGSQDKAATLCRRAGFRTLTYRGDPQFTPTTPLDRWDSDGLRFLFGRDARNHLKEWAEPLDDLQSSEWERPPRSTITTVPRQHRERPKERIVAERPFETRKRIGEETAEFEERPVACKKTDRVLGLRQKRVVEQGPWWLFEPDRSFFSLTHDRTPPAAEIVVLANDRCDPEHLIAQVKSGVKALARPVDNRVSNGAYLVRASRAWSLKAWSALVRPAPGRWAEKSRAAKRSRLGREFSRFCVAMIPVACPIVRTAGRIVDRWLSWNPWQGVFLRWVERLHGRRWC